MTSFEISPGGEIQTQCHQKESGKKDSHTFVVCLVVSFEQPTNNTTTATYNLRSGSVQAISIVNNIENEI